MLYNNNKIDNLPFALFNFFNALHNGVFILVKNQIENEPIQNSVL